MKQGYVCIYGQHVMKKPPKLSNLCVCVCVLLNEAVVLQPKWWEIYTGNTGCVCLINH